MASFILLLVISCISILVIIRMITNKFKPKYKTILEDNDQLIMKNNFKTQMTQTMKYFFMNIILICCFGYIFDIYFLKPYS